MSEISVVEIMLEGICLILERKKVDFASAAPAQFSEAIREFLQRAGESFLEYVEKEGLDALVAATVARREAIKRARVIIGEVSLN